MTENKNVPRIRFDGFNDAWEQRKLDMVTSIFDNKRMPVKSTDRKKGKIPYYGANGIQDFVSGFTHDGEYILVAEDGANNLVNYPVNYINGKVWVNNHAHVLQGIENSVCTKFLLFTIQSMSIQKWLVGGGRSKLNAEVLKNIVISFPETQEQFEISNFLFNLNDLIASNQRKLDLLKEIKKSMMQKIFDQTWRFEGFTDPWEQRKLGDLADFLNGRAYKQDELLDSGKYPVLRVGNFNTNNQWYYSNLELPEKNYANNGDLLYTWATAFGPHIWRGPRVIYHYHIWKIKLGNDLDRDFTVHLLNADQVQMTNNLNGSTMVHITKQIMENKLVHIPVIDEQISISRLLDIIDHLIALHQLKIDKLKEIKKWLMQNMFV